MNPGKFEQINVTEILTHASQTDPTIVSSIIQRLRNLYQSPVAFDKTKPF